MTSNNRTVQPPSDAAGDEQTRLPRYEIRVHGHLGSRWAAWFEGMDVTTEADGTTLLRGPVVDQAALHGLLAKLRDLGIPLVSLADLHPGRPTAIPDLNTTRSSHQPQGETS